MAQIINLRTVKKQAARKAARAKANENAVRFGQSKAERDLERVQAQKSARELDAHKRGD